jgi:MoxR-like ATPase
MTLFSPQPPTPNPNAQEHPHLGHRLMEQLNKVLLGKEEAVQMLCAAVLAGGHVLIEDLPGSGKTSLAKALSLALGLPFRRVQFTPDLMPADLTGSMVWNQGSANFEFRPGPLFCSVLLADEINRASPRTQSALLEAMEERKVSVEGVTEHLPAPFLVLATQNPLEHHGVYPLPEAQMDRFLMRLELGFPDAKAEAELLIRPDRDPAALVTALTGPVELLAVQAEVAALSVHPDLIQWLVNLLQQSRRNPQLGPGLSPRAGQAVLALAKALAWLDARDYVMPEDIDTAWIPATAHRLFHRDGRSAAEAALKDLRRQVPPPR